VVKAVLFDFWGTLAENGTYSPLKQTYRMFRVSMDYGEFVEKFERAFMTKPFDDMTSAFNHVINELGARVPPFIVERLVGIWNKNKLFATLYPETIEVLKALKEKGIKVAIVSNTPKGSAEDVIEKFELRKYVDGIFLSWETGKLKTDEDAFELVLDKLGVKKKEALMVGDSMETDVLGAEQAGISALLIDRKGTRSYEKKIKDLKELIGIV